MLKKFNELLPIGSVIHVKGANKNMMIVGTAVIAQNTEFNYMGVLYPEGYVDDKHTYLFNHDDIDQVLFLGYVNSEMQVFRTKIAEQEKKGN